MTRNRAVNGDVDIDINKCDDDADVKNFKALMIVWIKMTDSMPKMKRLKNVNSTTGPPAGTFLWYQYSWFSYSQHQPIKS